MKETLRKETGITLISLVITIIVLLILAATTISMLSGDNGILKQAGDASDETKRVAIEETIRMAVIAGMTAGEGELDTDRGKEVFSNELKKEKIISTDITITSFPYTIEKDGYKYTIKANGEITKPLSIENLKVGNYVYYQIPSNDTTSKYPIDPNSWILYNISDSGQITIANMVTGVTLSDLCTTNEYGGYVRKESFFNSYADTTKGYSANVGDAGTFLKIFTGKTVFVQDYTNSDDFSTFDESVNLTLEEYNKLPDSWKVKDALLADYPNGGIGTGNFFGTYTTDNVEYPCMWTSADIRVNWGVSLGVCNDVVTVTFPNQDLTITGEGTLTKPWIIE